MIAGFCPVLHVSVNCDAPTTVNIASILEGAGSGHGVDAKQSQHAQNHWVYGIRPASGILNTRKHNVSEAGSVSLLR
jgi:hypothetical protein